MANPKSIRLADIDLRVDGRVLKTARLRDEYYVAAADPQALIARLSSGGGGADLFTFVQELHDPKPRFEHLTSFDELAVLPLTTYEHWLHHQLKFKPRNRLRKALKSGVETRHVTLSDDLVHGIMGIYDETPIRQGKRNWHYRKDFETVKREHSTFLDRSDFIGAFFKDELIGFAKVTHSENLQYSSYMNIVAKVAHRDKAPVNALLAKTVELVAARGIPRLHYGDWGRGGLNDFKVTNAFECVTIPRYHVPLTRLGEWAVKLNLHRGVRERLPEDWRLKLAGARTAWNEWRYREFAELQRAHTPEAEVSVPLHGKP